MGTLVDLTGRTYGRLTVLGRAGSDRHGGALWLCHCDCGEQSVVRGNSLQSDKTHSCGCLSREYSRERMAARNHGNEYTKTHGLSLTSEYHAWQQAIQRTTNPNNSRWKDYGGRGITIAPEWLGDSGFEEFYAHIGPKPDPELTLDRINNDGGYQPDNVRWADRLTQTHNRRAGRSPRK